MELFTMSSFLSVKVLKSSWLSFWFEAGAWLSCLSFHRRWSKVSNIKKCKPELFSIFFNLWLQFAEKFSITVKRQQITLNNTVGKRRDIFHFDKLQHEGSLFVDELIHNKMNSVQFLEFSYRTKEMYQRTALSLF